VLATDYPFEQMHLGIDFIKSLPISDHERTQVCETNTRELLKL
jgi:predicted TIM-barrel fold metal-dependent hydrolase